MAEFVFVILGIMGVAASCYIGVNHGKSGYRTLQGNTPDQMQNAIGGAIIGTVNGAAVLFVILAFLLFVLQPWGITIPNS